MSETTVANNLINPIIPGFYPDPSVCRVGEDYYLVTSTFEYFPGVPIFHSKDLRHWRQIGHCLTRDSNLPLHNSPASTGIYAPTIRHHDGVFYMITTNTRGGGNFLVTATDPTGPWSDPIWIDIKGIDPSLLFDDDGKVYFTLNQNRQFEIDVKTGKLLTEERIVWGGTGGRDMEAPHLYKINGRYYLLVAEGGTARGHMVTIARSNSPWGPFESCPHNPILTNRERPNTKVQCVGHGDLIEAHDGSWWIVYLAVRDLPMRFPFVHNLGRETFIAPVQWKDGWPVVNENGSATLEVNKPFPGNHPWPAEPARDNFDADKLAFAWCHLRNPKPQDYSLSARPGWLRLNGSAATLDDPLASPACVLRRQQHHHCEVSTLIDFNPSSDNERAGLTVLMNDAHHYDIYVTRKNGKRVIEARRNVADMAMVTTVDARGDEPIVLGITADDKDYTLWHSNHVVVTRGTARLLTTEVAGGFTGMMMGLFATGNGQRCNTPADFDWFEYREVPTEALPPTP